jgi:hypothetical protein
MPLAKTQPQFGSGRIVSEKSNFAKPSTIKKTIKERQGNNRFPRTAKEEHTNLAGCLGDWHLLCLSLFRRGHNGGDKERAQASAVTRADDCGSLFFMIIHPGVKS